MKFKPFYLFFILAIFAAVSTLALDDHLVKRQENDEKDVEAKVLIPPADPIFRILIRKFGAPHVAKCRANSCRGCLSQICKSPNLSCCNLACKIGIGARIPRVGGRC